MGSVTWACFDCRLTVRRPGFVETAACSRCAGPMRNLGTKIRIPPKHDEGAWRRLRGRLNARAASSADARRRSRVRERHALEKELARFKARPSNKDRAKVIQGLEKRIRELSE